MASSEKPQRITIIQPDDWHLHLRDGDALRAVIPDTARRFGRAIIMPNLKPPVRTVAEAEAYRARIFEALEATAAPPPKKKSGKGQSSDTVPGFEPLMTLYLTNEITAAEIKRAAKSDFVHGVKLYPAGATTNSEAGVSSLESLYPIFEAMEKEGLVLQVHGEVTDASVDVFDREKVFVEQNLAPIVKKFPGLKLVLEHVTTKEGAAFVQQSGANVAGTVTPQHLLMNRNALFTGGLRPHHFCLPVLKREEHRQALVAAATADAPDFFLGTDSAPHGREAKETACGCAGIYSAHAGIEFYAEVFDEAGALDRLEDFASRRGPAFYGLPVNEGSITLEKKSMPVPESIPFGTDVLVPLRAGGEVAWRIV